MVEPPWHQVAVIPQVFADGETESEALEFNRSMGHFVIGRLKVSCFVEDIVGWQQTFEVPMRDATLITEGRRIAEAAPDGLIRSGGIADNGCSVGTRGRQTVDGGRTAVDDLGFKQKIFRRVAEDSQFRQHDELGAFATSLVNSLSD